MKKGKCGILFGGAIPLPTARRHFPMNISIRFTPQTVKILIGRLQDAYLMYRHSPGRKPRLTKTQKQRLKALVEAGPQAAGFQTASWDQHFGGCGHGLSRLDRTPHRACLSAPRFGAIMLWPWNASFLKIWVCPNRIIDWALGRAPKRYKRRR